MCHRHTPSSKKIYPRKSSLRNSFELFVWRLRASSLPPQTVWKVSTRAEKSVPHYRGDNEFSILGGGNYTFKTVSPCCPPRQSGQVRLPSVRALGWEWKTSGSTASSKEDSGRCRLTEEAGIKWRFFTSKNISNNSKQLLNPRRQHFGQYLQQSRLICTLTAAISSIFATVAGRRESLPFLRSAITGIFATVGIGGNGNEYISEYSEKFLNSSRDVLVW